MMSRQGFKIVSRLYLAAYHYNDHSYTITSLQQCSSFLAIVNHGEELFFSNFHSLSCL